MIQKTCKNCQKNFKIVKQKLDYYRKHVIPVPQECPDCRYSARIKLRSPRRLWHRQCMNEGCNNEFETTYSPDRPEKVYCEECYHKEIY